MRARLATSVLTPGGSSRPANWNLKIGEIEVPDMMGYMTGLSKHEKGDSTTVIVNRNNKKMKFPIVFQ